MGLPSGAELILILISLGFFVFPIVMHFNQRKVLLVNSISHEEKEVPFLFSWTSIVFGIFVPLLRGDIKWFFIYLVASIFTFGIATWILAFFYNKYYINDLIQKGFLPANKESKKLLVSENMFNENTDVNIHLNTSTSSDTSLVKAVYNHSKDLANEIKPKINNYIEKHKASEKQIENNYEALDEDAIYETALTEIEEDKKVKSTWAKAIAQSEGNKEKAEALYINLRVEAITKDQKVQYEQIKSLEKQTIHEVMQTQEQEDISEQIIKQREKEGSKQTTLASDILIFFLMACLLVLIFYTSIHSS